MNDKPSAILDTCVLVDILRNRMADHQACLDALDFRKCAIVDLTVFELLCGAELSMDRDYNLALVRELVSAFEVIPSSNGYGRAASEKCRLKAEGTPIDDIDLLIGCACAQEEIPLVTGNSKHFNRIAGLNLIAW